MKGEEPYIERSNDILMQKKKEKQEFNVCVKTYIKSPRRQGADGSVKRMTQSPLRRFKRKLASLDGCTRVRVLKVLHYPGGLLKHH